MHLLRLKPENGETINYTQDTTIYKNKKNYSIYDGVANEMLKKENTPEFFACLPLIKI